MNDKEKRLVDMSTTSDWSFIYLYFFYLGFLSRTLTNHRTAGEGISLTPHYHFHQSHTLRQYPGDYCRELTSVHS